MSRTIEDLLPEKPQAHLRIYAYSIEDSAHAGMLKIGQTTRAVRSRVEQQVKTGDWNSCRILARGFTFQHEINGYVTAKVNDQDEDRRRTRGLLAFQLHKGWPIKIEFRNIRLPKTAGAEEDDGRAESLEGRILERIALFEQLTRLIDDLFRMFVNIRASQLWNEELVKIRAWINAGAHSA